MKTEPYDALLVVSFGGPEGQDDVIPFLENVLRGRNVPRERMEEVAEHYRAFGGVSPLNAQNRALIAALESEFELHSLDLPIYFGNRNWHPFLADALGKMATDGVKRALAFFTTPYSSYSSCRQYRENIMQAQAEVGSGAPRVDKLRAFYNHPDFVELSAELIRDGLGQLPQPVRQDAHITFTAHSIPVSMAQECRYGAQLEETARLVMESLAIENPWKLVYQSRSGPPFQPWLEPDILDHLEELHGRETPGVVVAPIGFLSDHMEVLYDLDTEARELAEKKGLPLVRAATVGTHPRFLQMIRKLVLERIKAERGEEVEREALGSFGASHDICPVNCCLPGLPLRRTRERGRG